jgi:hypothetical protein
MNEQKIIIYLRWVGTKQIVVFYTKYTKNYFWLTYSGLKLNSFLCPFKYNLILVICLFRIKSSIDEKLPNNDIVHWCWIYLRWVGTKQIVVFYTKYTIEVIKLKNQDLIGTLPLVKMSNMNSYYMYKS